MITGVHFLLHSADAEADRAFFRDVLQFRAIDAGGGWLIFALPPAELGIHPASGGVVQRHAEHDLAGAMMYVMCDDLQSTIKSLKARHVECTEVQKAEWGLTTTIRLPSGMLIGLYEPRHPTALALG